MDASVASLKTVHHPGPLDDSYALRRLKSPNNNGYNSYHQQQDSETDNVSFRSNDEDPILTATITFDVTVDPYGQVISTSEGQVIAESIQNPDGTPRQKQLTHLPTDEQADKDHDGNHKSGGKHKQHHHHQQNNEDSDDSTSTTTESLIERSKKYMNQEAGIIILKREDGQPPNKFDINLDFDLNNKDQNQSQTTNTAVDEDEDDYRVVRRHTPRRDDDDQDDYDDDDDVPNPKGFNINFDFDFKKMPRDGNDALDDEDDDDFDDLDRPKGFKINVDFDLNDPKLGHHGRNTGVDIDLMITSDSKVETTETVEDLDERGHILEENEGYRIRRYRGIEIY